MNSDEWVLVVQNTATCTYQILDERHACSKSAKWMQLCKRVIVYGLHVYGIL